jgi:hypothetical protein
MRAYELMKETFFRKMYIYIVHMVWFAVYGIFLVLFNREEDDFYRIFFIWGGFFLPLVLSAGIFGDDLASGRICVLATRPFWLGELYIYRLLGLSGQAAAHFILAGCLLLIVHHFIGIGNTDNLGLWLLSSWLLFNAWAAISTSLSVVVKRAYNFIFLLAAFLFFGFLNSALSWYNPNDMMTDVIKAFVKYACPPFGFLTKLAQGEYSKHSLIVGQYSGIKAVACIIHSFVLTGLYSLAGVLVLSRRQFTCSQE